MPVSRLLLLPVLGCLLDEPAKPSHGQDRAAKREGGRHLPSEVARPARAEVHNHAEGRL